MSDPTVHRISLALRSGHASPAEIGAELEQRLVRLPYVISARFAKEIREFAGERWVDALIVLVPQEELPEDDPHLAGLREALSVPYSAGWAGEFPDTPSRLAQELAERLRRHEAERRLERDLAVLEELRAELQDAGPGAFVRIQGEQFRLPPHFELPVALSHEERELAVALNLLWEEIDWVAYLSTNPSEDEAPVPLSEAGRAGLSVAQAIVQDELSRRSLPLVARRAPWPSEESKEP